jgi:DNA polymerase
MSATASRAQRPSRLSPQLAELLAYLADIGWGDVYLRKSRPPLDPRAQERAAQLEALGVAAAACTRCRLAEGRSHVVFGAGNPQAELMFVGEGPGAEEDRQGLPFVGPAGELLTKIIQAIELTREEVYIANVVKCRPPGNRDPQPDEVTACRGFLDRQIELVGPRLLVALGKVAAQVLLGTDSPIGQLRGRWHAVQGIPTLVTYHPAALLRNAALKRPTWEDMQLVRDRLRESEP